MPYSFYWQNKDHTIVRIDMHDEVTWREWHATLDQIAHLLQEAADRRIDIILNQSVDLPPGNPRRHIVKTAQKLQSYPNLGIIVTVNHGEVLGLTKAVVELTLRAQGMEMCHYGGFVRSLCAALDAIALSRVTAMLTI